MRNGLTGIALLASAAAVCVLPAVVSGVNYLAQYLFNPPMATAACGVLDNYSDSLDLESVNIAGCAASYAPAFFTPPVAYMTTIAFNAFCIALPVIAVIGIGMAYYARRRAAGQPAIPSQSAAPSAKSEPS